MPQNLILEEIYAARDKLLADRDGDVHAYIQQARQRALASGRPIAKPKQRAKPWTGPAHSDGTKTEDSVAAAR